MSQVEPERTLVRQSNTSHLINLEEWLLLEARRYVHADEGTVRCRGAAAVDQPFGHSAAGFRAHDLVAKAEFAAGSDVPGTHL